MSIFEQFDRVSFWLGFLAASLFWWMASRLWRNFPEVRKYLKNRVQFARSRQAAGIDGILRQEIAKRAQHSHISAPMFSLDEVVTPPQLLAPPPLVDPDNPDAVGSFKPAIIPPLPLVPQFSAQYGADTIPLSQAVRSGANLAVIGYPGCGKSTALAYLANLFARKDNTLGALAQSFPIWLHVNDLALDTEPNQLPLDILIRALTWYSPTASRTQVPGFIKKAVESRNALVILDGLDEIPFEQYNLALAFLGRLIKDYPKLQIVITAAINRAQGLFDLGIEPMVLAGWNRSEIKAFSKKWGVLWGKYIASQPFFDYNNAIDDILINSWQTTDGGFYSPLELTLRLWAAFAGDLSGNRGVDGFSAYFSRLEAQGIHLRSIASLADQLISRKQGYTTFIDAEKEFAASGASYGSASEPVPGSDGGSALPSPIDALRPGGKARTSPNEEKSIDMLIKMGVLKEHPNDRLAFTSPSLWGYVASLSNYTYDLSSKSPEDDPWSPEEEFFHYLLASTPADWLKTYLARDSGPFYWRSTQVARWLSDVPASNANRSAIMRHILALVQSESIGYPSRLGLLGSAAMSNDAALSLLMRQLAVSQSVPLRQISALCAGVLGDTKMMPELTTLGTDQQELVRFAACFAIAALESPEAQATLNNTINQADEHMRLVAGEAVASRPPWGHKILRDAAASKDLLTRRAAIFGLDKIHAPWVVEVLEKVATEDGQYMVRNMAVTVLEAMQHGRNSHPVIQPTAMDTPWLIAFAAKGGRGIPHDESPVPLLARAAETGNADQQIAAVQLLARVRDVSAFEPLQKALGSSDLEVRIAAHYALWFRQLNQITRSEPLPTV